ncbi:unnamed protein product [Kluyveromyces dobzhanskii CBS 2104]|uniref:WGS project CCBQ000000000 data, contig 00015 n=1 Tax=Kluyveromyces dobzhanskii CBS 2104 TaxID=1427455 RepID=A0A0A8LCG5_9SACH|nr:unnamed protein product [Kluyveromyces dobzhanskii CBS 2104]
MTQDMIDFPKDSLVKWALMNQDVELIEGGMVNFAFNESLQPFESLHTKQQDKFDVIPVLNYMLCHGEFDPISIVKNVAVTFKWEQNETGTKGWVQFYHDRGFLGKWDCSAMFQQFKQIVLCVEAKIAEKEAWNTLVRDTEEREKEESATRNGRGKKRKLTPRDKITYKFENFKVHPLILSIDTSGNWAINIQMSLLCVVNDSNYFSKESNRLLSELFHEKCPQYFSKMCYGHQADCSNEFNDLINSYTKHTLRKDVKVSTPGLLDVKLMPFQMESVEWMLRKEGFFNEPIDRITGIKELGIFLNEHVSYSYEFMPINNCFWNKIMGYILPLKTAWNIYEEWFTEQANGRNARGLLADEMGLGKTVEMLSVITTNKRDLSNVSSTFVSSIHGKEIRRAKTNLVICPAIILEQWIDEIKLHVNGTISEFKVFHYEGLEKMQHKFNERSSIQLAKMLSEYDVVICSDFTLEMEFKYAELSFLQRSTRNTTRKGDYISPLTLVEFFRIIMDELQCLGHSLSNGTRYTQLIHRVHTWGVSGTAVQTHMQMQCLLVHLQLHPFQVEHNVIHSVCYLNEANRRKWQRSKDHLTFLYENWDSNDDWVGYRGCRFTAEEMFDIFPKFNLASRHTKKDVQDQIKIPKQKIYLVPVELNQIEQDNYANVWDSFLIASGYDSRSNGNGYLDFEALNRWLTLLRLTCCHASLTMDHYYVSRNKRWRANDQLESMDSILDFMKEEVLDRIHHLQRENYIMRLQLGQTKLEFDKDYATSCDIFQNVIQDITSDLRNLYAVDDFLNLSNDSMERRSAKATSNMRSLLQILHQTISLQTRSYFSLGSRKLELNDGTYDTANTNKDQFKNETTNCSKISKNSRDSGRYSDDEFEEIHKYQKLEKESFDVAEKLRAELLREHVADINAEINDVRNWLFHEDLNQKLAFDLIISNMKNYALPLGDTPGYLKIVELFEKLNSQSEHFNKLIKELETLSFETAINQFEGVQNFENSEAYNKLIGEQNKMVCLTDVLQRIVKNREDIAISERKLNQYNAESLIKEADSEFHRDLLRVTPFLGGDSLRMLLNSAENDPSMKYKLKKSKFAHHNVEEFVKCYETEVTRILGELKKIKCALEKFGGIQDAKTNYLSQLQTLSDSIPPLANRPATVRKSIIKKVLEGKSYDENHNALNKLKSRLGYLDTLTRLKSSIVENASITCTICYSEIYTGSILKCGHFFCKGCVVKWFEKDTSCPMCKSETTSFEVYHFKFREEQFKDESDTKLAGNLLKQTDSSKSSNDTTDSNSRAETVLTRKFNTFPQINEVNRMVLDGSWGGKVDQALKLILYIKQQHLESEPLSRSPQIVIFSIHPQFFDILGKVLAIHDIRYGYPYVNSTFAQAVNTFRRDPECTCLFLRSNQEATGLTLVNARHVFIMDPILERSVEAQAISRVHRIGQKHETYVWNFMVRNTVEESIMNYKAALEAKNKQYKEERSTTDEAERSLETDLSLDNLCASTLEQSNIWHCFFENGI